MLAEAMEIKEVVPMRKEAIRVELNFSDSKDKGIRNHHPNKKSTAPPYFYNVRGI
jgi:hypothetical protein